MYKFLSFSEELSVNCLTLNSLTIFRLKVEGEGKKVEGEDFLLRVRARS